MEEVREWLKGLGERVSDPFLFAASFTWAVLNWRFLVVVLSHGPKDEPYVDRLVAATKALGPHWVDTRGLDLALGAIAAVCVGLLYAFAYPLLAWMIRNYRDGLKVQEDEKAALRRFKSDASVQRERHFEAVLTRKQWLSGTEITDLQNTMARLFFELSPLEPKGPSVALQFYAMPNGVVDLGFGYKVDGKITHLPPDGLLPENLVYVVAVFPSAHRALVGDAGAVVPAPDGNAGFYDYIQHDASVRQSREPPANCAAHVRRLDGKWGLFARGAPKQ